MHLIYARFVNIVLYDVGIVPTEEPFGKVIHQGMITKDGHKMSKSKGNAVSSDDYNADDLRMYLMFLGPYFEGGDWNDQHIVGVQRFFTRMKTWLTDPGDCVIDTTELEDQIDRYVASFKFNKVVSSFMEFMNKNKSKKVTVDTRDKIVSI